MPADLVAALAGKYRLDREIGAGGMATVYLAEDVKHRRRVAVKVLRPELAQALGTDRFLREITTTAGLRHPNILPLFDSGEGAGFLYYVMPFVEGESLRDRMTRESQLPIDDALRIADEVADALQYAHAQGVVHRDIKPENIMLENGRAVVADFGIAHAVTASGSDKLTMTGMSLGTPHYMSPEQASGEAVDARSDLYALGCMLYEMLAGAPPFTGPNAMAIMARHMLDPVPKLTTVRPTVKAHVTSAIERSLAKAPADRFPGIAQWRGALSQPVDAVASDPEGARAILKAPPIPATPLLGREEDVRTAIADLASGARVLTITGVGGTGKTRLAIELFGRLHDKYEGGAAFVSLASVTSAAEAMPAVATALDIAEAHGRSALDALSTVIGAQRVLLVLDNLEQVVEAASELATLVSRCAELCVIATSRRPLKIGAEVELALAPLALPEAGATEVEAIGACPSVALFVQRAEKVKSGFALTAANAVSIASICRRLDGLPLALELAAARVRILEPAVLLQRLDHALDLLTSGDRDLPLRQRTLRATISWSYSLLDDSEQRLLRRLAVFHEGWTFDAVEQVCYAAADRSQALDALESLVEKGLVRVIDGGARYALLETIRAFAAELSHAGGETEERRDAHAAYFVGVARGVHEGIVGHTQLEAMRVGRQEHANCLAALHWLVARARTGTPGALERGLLLCGNLTWYWHIVGSHVVVRQALDVLLPLADPAPPSEGRAVALFASGMMATVMAEPARAIVDWGRMLDDARAIGDETIVAGAHCYLGYVNLGAGNLDAAGAHLAEATERADRLGHDFLGGLSRAMHGMQKFASGDAAGGVALAQVARRTAARIGDFEGGGIAISLLASMTFSQGDLSGALALYAEAEEAMQTVGDKPEVARVQCEAGYVALAAEDVPEARRNFQRALRTYDEVGSPRGTGQALIGLAATEAAAGNAERAVRIAAAAQVMSERAGIVVEHPMAPGVAARIEALRATIPRDSLESLVASGGALSPAAVLAMVAE